MRPLWARHAGPLCCAIPACTRPQDYASWGGICPTAPVENALRGHPPAPLNYKCELFSVDAPMQDYVLTPEHFLFAVDTKTQRVMREVRLIAWHCGRGCELCSWIVWLAGASSCHVRRTCILLLAKPTTSHSGEVSAAQHRSLRTSSGPIPTAVGCDPHGSLPPLHTDGHPLHAALSADRDAGAGVARGAPRHPPGRLL